MKFWAWDEAAEVDFTVVSRYVKGVHDEVVVFTDDTINMHRRADGVWHGKRRPNADRSPTSSADVGSFDDEIARCRESLKYFVDHYMDVDEHRQSVTSTGRFSGRAHVAEHEPVPGTATVGVETGSDRDLHRLESIRRAIRTTPYVADSQRELL